MDYIVILIDHKETKLSKWIATGETCPFNTQVPKIEGLKRKYFQTSEEHLCGTT